MSSYDYNFNCSIIGLHPVTLIMDLNRKVFFNLRVKHLGLPENYSKDEAYSEDLPSFWNRVLEKTMTIRVLS